MQAASLAAAGAVAGVSLVPQDAEVRWAFLSDTHLPASDDVAEPPAGLYGYDPHGNVRRVVEEISRYGPDGVVLCGDLARQEGLIQDYEKLHGMLDPLAARTPVHLILGNHDDRSNFRRAFRREAEHKMDLGNRLAEVVQAGPVRLVLLDSLLVTNIVPGFLGKDQRAWLQRALAEDTGQPTLVVVHHTLGDGDYDLLDTDRLLRLLVPNHSVKAVIFGHSHQFSHTAADGLHFINLPAVGYAFDADAPLGWLEASLGAASGRFRLHAVGGNMRGDGEAFTLGWRE